MMKYVILHDIRSHHNVGAIFRTADGAGVSKIFITGYTPAPIDRFGRVVPEIVKTSLGASAMVPWEKGDITEVINSLKENNVSIVAVEQADQSISLYDFNPTANVAYIFGNEVLGVPAEVQDFCDVILEIPMRGQKESLNVAVTAGIILFQNPL